MIKSERFLMTQTRRKRNKKWIYWLVFLVLIVVAAVVCYFVWDSYFKDKSMAEPTDGAKATMKVEEKKAEQKDEKKAETDVEKKVLEKEKVVQYDGADPNEAAGITGAITYAKVSGENLVVRVNIDQYLSNGICTLSLQRDGAEIYNEKVGIVDSASTATCEGFNVPAQQLGSGVMDIVISLESDGKNGVISGSIEL